MANPFIFGCVLRVFQRAGSAHLIEELLCPTKDVFKLRQFQEVLLQCFLVGVYLLQFVLQLFKGGLPDKVNTWFGRRNVNQWYKIAILNPKTA